MTPILVRENVSLAPLTTLKVGGAARFFVKAETETDVTEALRFARERGLPLFVLGGGSNLLVSDDGFDGLVVQIALRGIRFVEENSDVFVTAGAGEDWDALVERCVEQNLAGFECLSGIPGTVGGTPVQNVGAYGQEVSETIVRVRAIKRESGEIYDLTNADCRFAYRTSIFNDAAAARDKFIVLAVTYRLRQNGEPALRYKDLKKYFAENSEPVSLQSIRRAVLKIRRAKSMVIDATDPNSQSAGSFFKNPVVSPAHFIAIEQTAREKSLIQASENLPHFAAADETVKIPAAWLIEKSGFAKGFAMGRAGISVNHTLAIINRGGATAREIVGLMREIQTGVFETFRIALQPEPVLLGFNGKNELFGAFREK
jgi:UDP-N-acetylmuramate dehydrogenase